MQKSDHSSYGNETGSKSAHLSTQPSKRQRRWPFFVGTTVLILVLIPAIALPVWSLTSSATPSMDAVLALQSSPEVTVEQGDYLTFKPAEESKKMGLIFYPGGLVPVEAYAPQLNAIAANGYTVFAPSMPLNFAIFSPNVAQKIIDDHPEIQEWSIAGHSLGGSMAAQFAARNEAQVSSLVLWASYPAASSNLSQTSIDVLSIFGTQDGLIEPEVIEQSRELLPADSQFVPVTGGNHAQFGSYGLQEGDSVAAISASDQLQVIVDATVAFLDEQ